MRTLIKDALILPMNEKFLSFKGDILLEGEKIKKIGSINEECDEIIDADNMIALPSFVNAHTHAAMTLLRNYKDTSESVSAWLSEIWPLEDKFEKSDVYFASLLAIAELISSGCTTFADMYFHAESTIKAVKEAGVRASISLTFFGDLSETNRRIREVYPVLEEERGDYKDIRIDAAVHAIYTCEEKTIRKATEWASEKGSLIHTHIAENIKECNDSINDFGLSPVKYLSSLGFFSVPTLLSHAVHLTDGEVNLLSSLNERTTLVNCPSSNLKLYSGIAPFSKYIRNNINTALGTDGAASNNNLSMIKEINLSSLLMEDSRDRSYNALYMATLGGAKALLMEDKIGTIEEGKDADIVLINTDDINTTPLNDPFSAIVFSSDRKNIDTVFCKGKKLLEKGNLLILGEDEVKKNVDKSLKNILSR